jgi:hypothetical protein
MGIHFKDDYESAAYAWWVEPLKIPTLIRLAFCLFTYPVRGLGRNVVCSTPIYEMVSSSA